MHAVNWFEIPSHDFQRAVQFYQTILSTELHIDTDFGAGQLAVFPHSETGVGGAVIKADHLQPSDKGTLAYLNATELDAVLAKVELAGGAIIMPKTFLREDIGHIAVIRDTEGNTVGLHTPH